MLRTLPMCILGSLLLVAVACGGGDDPAASSQGADGGGTVQLVQRLQAADGLEDAALVVKDIATVAGIAVLDYDREVDREAVAPASGLTMAPFEAIQLADDVRAPSPRTTLQEYAELLAEFGWPFHPDRPAGEQLRDALAVWTREAWRAPSEPRNFAPMFLAEMADQREPSLNLTAGDYDPSALSLSTLELYVLDAGIRRLVAPNPPSIEPQQSPAGGMRLPGWLPVSRAHAQEDACGWAKPFWGEWAGAVVDHSASQYFGYLLDNALSLGGEALSAAVGTAMTALGNGFQAIKLAQFYYVGHLVVEPLSDDVVEKPLRSEGDRLIGFVASAGMTEDEWEVVKEEREQDAAWADLNQCLSYFGFPDPPDWDSVVAGLDRWRVEWRLMGDDAEIVQSAGISDLDGPGVLAQRVERSNEHSGTALLTARLKPQVSNDRTGEPREGQVQAKAMLDTSSAPFIDASGGLTIGGTTSNLIVNAVRSFAQPTAHAAVRVREYGSDGGTWVGTIRWTETGSEERSDRQVGDDIFDKDLVVREYSEVHDAFALLTLDGSPPLEAGTQTGETYAGEVQYQATAQIVRFYRESDELECAIPGTYTVSNGYEHETREWERESVEEGSGSLTLDDTAEVHILVDEERGRYQIKTSLSVNDITYWDRETEWTGRYTSDAPCPSLQGRNEGRVAEDRSEDWTESWNAPVPDLSVSGTFEPGEEPIIVGRSEEERGDGTLVVIEWRLERSE